MPKKKFRVRHRMNAQNSKGNRKRRRYENASSLPSAPLVFNIPRFSDTANDAVTTTQPLPVSQQEGKETTLKSATSYNTDTIMSYRGYTLKKVGEPIDYICPATITPKEFFDKYVKRRRPVVLSSSLDRIDQRWKGRKETWTNDYLCKVAGESSVRVEYREKMELIISDETSSSLRIFSRGGNKGEKLKLESTLGIGYDSVRFDRPMGIAVDSEGRIVVADSGNNRVQVLDESTREVVMILDGRDLNFNENNTTDDTTKDRNEDTKRKNNNVSSSSDTLSDLLSRDFRFIHVPLHW